MELSFTQEPNSMNLFYCLIANEMRFNIGLILVRISSDNFMILGKTRPVALRWAIILNVVGFRGWVGLVRFLF